MKKLLLILFCLPLLFTTCKKEEDDEPINSGYNCLNGNFIAEFGNPQYLSLLDCQSVCGMMVGCTDSTALNYNPLATIDDGSCVYCVYGCMDINAFNYTPLATCNDGSCLYQCDDPYATNYNVPTTYLVCEYEADVVFYLDVQTAQEFTNLGIPFLDVYVVNDLAGTMPTNVGFTSTVTCTDTDPEPVHFTYQWEDAQSTTLTWSVRDGTGFIWYEGTNLVLANECISLQLSWSMVQAYQNAH